MDLSYYVHNFWVEHGDAEVNSQLIDGPWKPMFAVALYAFFALHAGWKIHKVFDMRPWMLVFNGFMFGVNGAGVLVALWVTQLGANSWSCSDKCERWEGVQGITAKYLGFVYVCVKITDFMINIFDVLRKRESADVKNRVIHDAFAVAIAYMGLKFYPRGFYWFFPLMDCLMQSIRYAYFVLSSAGSGLRFALWWKQYVNVAQVLQSLVIIGHMSYLLLAPNCAGPMFLKLMILTYGAGNLLYYGELASRGSMPAKRD